ncbi:prepilin-type N-terminal cleavage/methylation domain-containing protein [uncultured Methylibium sp.]|uniref:prepilin-type N-terminal cleavage/methylation domain-containing protein n=1 Tax=uncultured Methylibium sp. TaxID=381093 RepID=UPI0026003F07|nr:prepilin-type N-terminal cleavage/methylation domain-containing protein [uncultured Methylibium sp.]
MRPQRGLSLIELLLGCAVGLLIAGGATRLFVEHLRDSRRLLLEARLHQDLRAAAALVARDLRRAGFWQQALAATVPPRRPNPYRDITPSVGPGTDVTTYSFSRDTTENDLVDLSEATGFRLSQGTLQTLNGGSWQALTDPAVLRVTRFVVSPRRLTIPLGHLCHPACDATTTACPSLTVRSYRLELHGESASDSQIQRQIHEAVRVRNDEVAAVDCP